MFIGITRADGNGEEKNVYIIYRIRCIIYDAADNGKSPDVKSCTSIKEVRVRFDLKINDFCYTYYTLAEEREHRDVFLKTKRETFKMYKQ